MGSDRSLLFTFYGSVRGMGARARSGLIKHWGGRLDRGFSVGFNAPHKNGYYFDIERSQFCGAPHGDGWGSRLVICILRGSIPVILQESSTLPLEPWLDYSAFSVRLTVEEIPELENILRAIPAAQLSNMRHRLLEVAPYFVWNERAGGQAFEAVMHNIVQTHSVL
jgi:xylogalacturonan beta-1,3-xylosyltransferase